MADAIPVKRVNGQYQRFGPTETLATSLYSTTVPAVSARALNSIFTINATRPTFVVYTIRITVNVAVIGNVEGLCQLLIGPSSPPTILACSTASSNNILGTIIQNGIVCSPVPAGWFVELKTTNVSGTPTFSIAAQTETPQ